MSSNREVRGYVFKSKDDLYYLEPMKGHVRDKAFAHVYLADEAKAAANKIKGWGGKAEGKWIVVYE